MKRVEDRGGTQLATKVEGGTSVFPVGARMVPDLSTTMPPTQGVTVTGPGNFNTRILSHNLAVYRGGDGATLTPAVGPPHHGPAPPAHAAQPSSVIHQMPANPVKTETISLSPANVSLQYSRSPNTGIYTGNSITVAAVTSPSLHNLQLASAMPQIVQKSGGLSGSGPHGVSSVFGGPTTVRTVTPAQNIPTSGNPSFQRLKVEDALSYLDQVKFKFGSQPQVYNDFLDIMKEFKSQSIDTPGVISRVSTLFRGHPELIVGFNTFLPPGYKIEVQTSENQHLVGGVGHPGHTLQTIVHTPHGIHMMGSQGMIVPAISTSTIGGGPPTINQIPIRSTHTPKYHLKTESSSLLPNVVTVPAPRSIITTTSNNDSSAAAQAAAAAVYAAVQQPNVGPPVITANLTSIIPPPSGATAAAVAAAAAAGPILPVQLSGGTPPTLASLSSGGPLNSASANVAAAIAAAASAGPHPNTNASSAGPTSTPPAASGGGTNQQQPVEFNHAINYVNKIKNRFQGQPDVYKQFLEILHTYQKDQRAIKDGGTPKSLLTETEVYAQVSRLFQNQDDLLAEFSQFLPEATNDSSTEAFQPVPTANNTNSNNVKPITINETSNNKRSTPKPVLPPLPTKQSLPNAGGDSRHPASNILSSVPPSIGANMGEKRPVQPNSRMQPPTKKPRLGVLKDVSLAEAGKFGTLNEYAFFDKVRKALNSAEVYENFLRCLVLFNQEVVSRAELVQLVNPFLNKNPELLKWFKDFVGFKDGARDSAPSFAPPTTASQELSTPMPPLHPPRHERMPGDGTAMEIDYASCKRLGASYCALPKNFVQPKCTGRGVGNTLCREVLNDTWVSFPSWSEDSQFVSSRKTQYEENIYRTEDERFEFDVVLETNRDTIKVLECVQKKMSRMPPEEAARYRLDDALGGTSPTIHQRAVKRIYGDKSADIIDGLKRNPVVAVPLVLRRLKAKDAEWREVQKQYNKIWREQNEKYYLKSLDHQGIIFKQNDVRTIRSKSLLNEIETLYDEAHEAEEQSGQPSAGPHITLQYKDKAMLEDASQLLIHHVKRQSGIHKADKHKIKTFLRQQVPDIFYHTRLEMSEEEDDEDDSAEESDPENKEEKDKKERNKVQDIEVKDEEIQEELKENKVPPHIKDLSPGEEYTMLMGNNHIYLFFRLHSILTERLAKIYDQAVIIAAEEGDSNQDKKESTAAALRLKPKNGLSATDYYPAFLDLVRNLLDGNMENQAYEDTLREMFGIHAFTAFTLDKVISNAVRQLQQIATDDTCQDCMELYQNERKSGGAGGQVSLAADRYYNELMYQKKSEKLLTDENCFKIIFYRESGKVSLELMDTDSSETRDGSGEDEGTEDGAGGTAGTEGSATTNPDAFLSNFLGMKISEEARNHFNLKPVFLRRSVRQYRKRNRHKIVQRPDKKPEDRPDATSPKPEEPSAAGDSNKMDVDPSTHGVGKAPSATTNASKTAAGSAVSRLGLDDASILVEEKSACSLTEDRLRIVWVVNSENYIYKRNSLNRAKQTHPDVCNRKYRKFNSWHSKWASQNVANGTNAAMAEWFMGRADGLAPNQTTKVIVNADTRKIPPYRTFTKYKAEMLKGP